MLADAVAGIEVVGRMRWLMALEVMAVLHVLLAVGPWLVLVPVIAQDRLGGTAGYGLVLSSFALGGVLGAAIAGWLQKRFRLPGLCALGALAFFGVACLAFAVTTSTVVLAGLFAVGGAGVQFFDVVKTTAIQSHVPGNLLGRVFALDFFASFVTMPAGQMLAGFFIADASQAVTAMSVGGLIVFATTLLPLFVRGVASMGGKPAPVEATG